MAVPAEAAIPAHPLLFPTLRPPSTRTAITPSLCHQTGPVHAAHKRRSSRSNDDSDDEDDEEFKPEFIAGLPLMTRKPLMFSIISCTAIQR